MSDSNGVWIALILAAASAQTIRNAAQRVLAKSAGVLPATFVRFCHGLPFAALGLAFVSFVHDGSWPTPRPEYVAWIALGAVAQLAATACLIAAMGQRSLVVAVAYSKTEILQVALYSTVLLAERLTASLVGAIVLSTIGVLTLSFQWPGAKESGNKSWLSAGAALGLASGAGYALSGVGFRGAMLALDHPTPWVAGIYSVVWAQAIQTVLLGLYLALRDRRGLSIVMTRWRASTFAGLMGALASMGWLTAYAMRSAVEVSVAGLVDVLISYAFSRHFFKEPVSYIEVAGITLVVVGIGMTTLRNA